MRCDFSQFVKVLLAAQHAGSPTCPAKRVEENQFVQKMDKNAM